MKPIISPQDLAVLVKEPAHLVLVDARSGPTAIESYQKEHLKGAHFVDLENDLAHKGASAAQGGRHPMPSPKAFSAIMNRLGITPNSRVVVYDDKNGANAAARFWWMVKAMGHDKVHVVDGGFAAAKAASVPVTDEIEKVECTHFYTNSEWQLPTANMEEVAHAALHPDYMVIDVREPARFRGELEPIDEVAGHIPGAVNYPFQDNLDSQGNFLKEEELKAKYTKDLQGKPADHVIVHCGSGVTACHTLLGMAQAGLEVPKLYVGSWSEWSRSGRPIAGQGATKQPS
ncbi:sulfurtransferase [Rufibacter sp. DG15C]|uniref:sulfurtransferase n=1 Tax=Rufibacter sp. DG15C TaxID=1379909 RepID=UPI00078ED914|nr:sulfurtransferase [Rufibacter sp. DG15C]AMM49947.1 sulfurtransferase [Rufibacter sp. DG15C]